MPDIYSPLAPFVPFSIHKGLSSTRARTRKAGCIKQDAGARRKEDRVGGGGRDRDERMRIAGPKGEKDTAGKGGREREAGAVSPRRSDR